MPEFFSKELLDERFDQHGKKREGIPRIPNPTGSGASKSKPTSNMDAASPNPTGSTAVLKRPADAITTRPEKKMKAEGDESDVQDSALTGEGDEATGKKVKKRGKKNAKSAVDDVFDISPVGSPVPGFKQVKADTEQGRPSKQRREIVAKILINAFNLYLGDFQAVKNYKVTHVIADNN